MSLFGDFPQTVVTITVWTYWTCVCVLVVRSHLRFRTAAGGLPRTGRERWMWALWVPAILLWQVLPAVAHGSTHWLVAALPAAQTNPVLLTLRGGAAFMAVVAFGLTVPCWLGMGRNWSMAIVPGKRSKLITNGLFAYVRHPIYALSILLMLATVSVTLSVAMTLVGVIHISMLYTKALSEERHLKGTHGPKYARYCEQTGRFVPRLVAPSHPQDEDSTPQDSPPKAA